MKLNIFIAAVTASCVAGAAFAQDQTAFENLGTAGDSFEDLQEDIADDAERDLRNFGNTGRPLGFYGSIAARGTLQNGTTDSLDVGLGANLGYYDGTNGYEFNLVYTYSDAEGEGKSESVVYGLEYNRDFTDALFGYAQIQGSNDEDASTTNDTFVGVGLGYYVINTSTQQWSVQAGPGYRVGKVTSLSSYDEPAFSVGSSYSVAISDTAAFTMDTDIISSESSTILYNDAAISVALNDSLALRTSLLTKYDADAGVGFDDTDQTLGMSIVYAFN